MAFDMTTVLLGFLIPRSLAAGCRLKQGPGLALGFNTFYWYCRIWDGGQLNHPTKPLGAFYCFYVHGNVKTKQWTTNYSPVFDNSLLVACRSQFLGSDYYQKPHYIKNSRMGRNLLWRYCNLCFHCWSFKWGLWKNGIAYWPIKSIILLDFTQRKRW